MTSETTIWDWRDKGLREQIQTLRLNIRGLESPPFLLTFLPPYSVDHSSPRHPVTTCKSFGQDTAVLLLLWWNGGLQWFLSSSDLLIHGQEHRHQALILECQARSFSTHGIAQDCQISAGPYPANISNLGAQTQGQRESSPLQPFLACLSASQPPACGLLRR